MRKLIACLFAATFVLVACTEEPDDRKLDAQTQTETINRLQAALPAPRVNYAPTRRSVIDWIERWDAPDKVAFVYLMADNGQMLGYYVARGLPVSYCVGLTPPDRIIRQHEMDLVVAAPALDGVYYSGGDCNHFYLFDAGTDAYIEFGGGVRFFVSDQPLPVEAEPLGLTTIEEAEAPGFEVKDE